MSQVAPIICQTFKGVLPSDLAQRYSGPNAADALEFDLEMCMEIQSQREDALGKTDTTRAGKGMGARLKQRQSRRKEMEGGEMLKHLKESGFIKEE